MITLASFFMGRDKEFSSELSEDIKENARILTLAVNKLLGAIKVTKADVTSGWRPSAINRTIGGATRSLHLEGKAVDLADPKGFLSYLILQESERLSQFDLWMEHPARTPGWVHLDIGSRSIRPLRIFLP